MQDVRQWLHEKLWEVIVNNDLPVPSKPHMDIILGVGHRLLELADVDILRVGAARAGRQIDNNHPICQSLRLWAATNVVQILYVVISRLPKDDGPFTAPLCHVTQAPSFIFALTYPLRALQEDGGVLGDILLQFNRNMAVISEELQNKRGFEATDLVTPQRYPYKDFERYFAKTPLLPLMQLLVPYSPFSNRDRFTHHWIMGHNGTGKTTYLRHLLKFDMESVAKGECSLVVIDSKKLIREMRELEIFGPYNALDGCLTLVDADDPFPLNPFYSESPKAVVSYMLANLTEASDLQAGAINFYINGVLASPEKNLRTMQKLIAMKKDEVPTKILDRLDKNSQNWFVNTRKTLAGLTAGGVAQRLDNFMDEAPLLNRMFEADSFGLDINDLHQGGKVWLIDTNRGKFGKDGANLLGRMIIALINQLSEYRTNVRGFHKPVWVYIDEAQDYIAQDELFVDILDKARSSNIGITVAHQYLGQIADPRVKGALENVGIKSLCQDLGSVQVKTRRDEFTIPVRPLEFEREPHMRPEDYQALRELLRFHYPYKKALSMAEAVEEPKSYKI